MSQPILTSTVDDLRRILLISSREGLPPKDAYRPVTDVPVEIVAIDSAHEGTEIVGRWTCNPREHSRLVWGRNDPVLAREVHIQFGKIEWRPASPGWPWYHTPCPLKYTKDDDFDRTFEHHAILLFIGGRWVTAHEKSAGFRGDRLSEVHLLVNDDRYEDNEGAIEIFITAYSQD